MQQCLMPDVESVYIQAPGDLEADSTLSQISNLIPIHAIL